jgi:tetratricopeptide (TPR) repeat protein
MNARTFLNSQNPGKQFRPRATQTGKASISPRPRRLHQAPNRLTSRTVTQKRNLAWLDPREQDWLLRQRSLSQAKQGNYQDAIEGLTLLINRNPESALDYNNRGLVHFQHGHFQAALDDYNRAIKLNSRLASAYNNRANYHVTQGNLADAIADYETAIDLDPTNIRAWINQGITFRDLEMYAQAIENFEHALQIGQLLARNPEENRFLEANIYAARGRTHELAGDWNYAIADYNRALDRLGEAETRTLQRLQTQVLLWLVDLQG